MEVITRKQVGKGGEVRGEEGEKIQYEGVGRGGSECSSQGGAECILPGYLNLILRRVNKKLNEQEEWIQTLIGRIKVQEEILEEQNRDTENESTNGSKWRTK